MITSGQGRQRGRKLGLKNEQKNTVVWNARNLFLLTDHCVFFANWVNLPVPLSNQLTVCF